jgi:hypothetical protein
MVQSHLRTPLSVVTRYLAMVAKISRNFRDLALASIRIGSSCVSYRLGLLPLTVRSIMVFIWSTKFAIERLYHYSCGLFCLHLLFRHYFSRCCHSCLELSALLSIMRTVSFASRAIKLHPSKLPRGRFHLNASMW